MRPLAALLAVLAASPLWAAPGDLTAIPAPMLGSDPPQTRDLAVGDASVSTQTGTMTYRYPIQAPPGRMGMAPALALVYSSQAAIYGGVAAGWSLDVPEIRLDVSESVLAQTWQADLDPEAWRREKYVSTMSGSRPLVVVDERAEATVRETYRAQHDVSYTRYERMAPGAPYLWRARTTDGTTHYFGDAAQWTGSARAVPLTRSVDAYGNQVEYWWADAQLALVRYTSNPAAGLPHFAEIRFAYVEERCPGARLPIGAAEDLRLGTIEGARKLTRITAVALDPAQRNVVHTRQYTLGYDPAAASCAAPHGPLRILTSIQESAWGGQAQPRVDLPPVTFEYNRLARTFDAVAWQPMPWAGPLAIDRHALSTGERGPGAQWNAVQSMLLDFDGDGLQDRLTSVVDPTAPDACAFAWERNLGRDATGAVRFDAISAPQRMPRLPWKHGTKGAGEQCNLNFQLTKVATPGENDDCAEGETTHLAYRWLDLDGDARVDLVAAIHRDSHFDPDRVRDPVTGLPYHATFFADLGLGALTDWPGCPSGLPDGGACPALDAGCIQTSLSCPHGEPCVLPDAAAQACVSQAPNVSCGVMQRSFDSRCTWDPNCPSYDPLLPFNPGGGASCAREYAHERCDRFPWLFFRNHGASLATVGEVKLQPVPLESDRGDSPAGGGGAVFSQSHAVTDLDGDGLVDLVVRGADFAPENDVYDEPLYWLVFRGDGDGGFAGPNAEDPYVWVAPPNATVTGGCGNGPGTACAPTTAVLPDHDIRGYASLLDLNGDGATDLAWSFDPQFVTQAFLSDGRKFGMYSSSVPLGDGLGASIDHLSRAGAVATDAIEYGPFVHWMEAGWKNAMTRPIDLDDDGRVDVARGSPSSFPVFLGPASLHVNQGGWFGSAVSLPSAVREAVMQRTIAFAHTDRWTWSTRRDLVDLDGDGLPEQWNFEHSAGQNGPTVHRDASDQPLRLLARVRNGRGGTVDITYAPTTNPEVVVQSPGFTLPHVQWVVRSLAVSDAWDSDVAKTSYRYERPIWNRDERGRWGFRGFDEVITTTPSGARVVESFAFTPDWSGRLAVSRTYAADAPHPATVERTAWRAFTLFGGALTTFHPTVRERWTCRTAQPEHECTAPTSARVKTVTDWQPLASFLTGDAPQLYLPVEERTQAGLTYGAGDRRTIDASVLYGDAARYRVQRVGHAAYESAGTHDELTDFQQWMYEPQYRQAERHVQYFAIDPDTGAPDLDSRATTAWTYDPATGVRTSTQTPENYPAGPREDYQYEPSRRFVTTTTNERGHVTRAAFEPGTGATLWQRGPNSESCGAGCTNHAQSWTDVDGLGRPIASYVNRGPSGVPWTKTLVARTTYTDAVVDGAPTRVRGETLVHYAPLPAVWTREDTDLDGRGRPIRIVAATGGPIDAVTTYDYDGRGHLVAVTLPDPSVDSAATVTYTYRYDSLGRPTGLRRPAVAGPDASGVDVTYDGLVQQSDEIAGSQGGPAARKVLVHDVFGRLVEVREYPTGPAGAPATTRYAYDARDAIEQIVSADGVVTDLAHDFAGRRTRITRAGKRTWRYAYDRNGNLVAEASPPPSMVEAAAYTSTFAYDELDRVTTRSIALRDKDPSDPDVALLGLGTIAFEYDACPGGIGRLCSATHPGGVVVSSYAYDAEGNPASQTRAFSIAGITGSRSVQTAFGPGGRVVEQLYPDGPTGAAPTAATFGYDARAKPATVTWHDPAGGSHLVAVQARNVAGLVTTRTAPLASVPGWHDFTSTFTYDRLTRVVEQRVSDAVTGVHAQQSLTYYGHDDPATLDHFLDGAGYAFAFAYDPRHQLIGVDEALGKYRATYGFTPGGRLLSASVSALPAPGGEVVDRTVGYEYLGEIDPEAPTALTVDGAPPLRTFTYDLAGNQDTATDGALTSTPTERFLYDGEDQLRRATRYAPGTTTVTGIEEYFYDHEGNRTAVLTRKANGSFSKLRVFVGDVELELDKFGNASRSFTHLSLGTPVARIERDPTGASTLELQYHGLANDTLAALAPDGTLRAGFVYGPYGDVLEATGTNLSSHRRRFNDEFRDDLTGLTYYGVRFYDSLALTWTQADPMYRFAPDSAWSEPREANLYHFALGNPLRYRDPDGRWLVIAVRAIRIAIVLAPIVARASPSIARIGAAAGLGFGAAKLRNEIKTEVPYSEERGYPLGAGPGAHAPPITASKIEPSAPAVPRIGAPTMPDTASPPPPDDCSDVPLDVRRDEFDNVYRPNYWKREARDNPGGYSARDIELMRQGKAPRDPEDNKPIELHHRRSLENGGCNSDDNLTPMTWREHRGKGNFRKNHPREKT